MSKLTIVRLGHPALRQRSKSVSSTELRSVQFQEFIDQLIEICDENNGVGIAAPQVNVTKRVIVVHVDPKNPRYKDKKAFKTTVVINPKLTKISKTLEEDWEGDLSCSLRALVPRPVSCVVEGKDRTGKDLRLVLNYPFHARVFIHEIDHLNGVFLLDKVKRKETISELNEWKKYWKPAESRKRLETKQ